MEERVRCLAEIDANETVTIERILFGCLRDHCADRGVHVGDRLSLESREERTLLLRKSDGQTVRCRLDLARFVAIGHDAEM